MEEFKNFERACLYPYYSFVSCSINGTDELLSQVSAGNYVAALKNANCTEALSHLNRTRSFGSILEYYKDNLLDYLEASETTKGEQVILCIGISCLQLFIQNNFCGPIIGPSPLEVLPGLIPEGNDEISVQKEAFTELVLDAEEIYDGLQCPEYLILARVVFYELRNKLRSCSSFHWWFCRYSIIHQQVVEEYSTVLYEALLEAVSETEKQESLLNETLYRDLAILFHVETCYLFLYYFNIAKARHHFKKALSLTGMCITFTGALGKRTKWQQFDTAQLVVKVSYENKSLPQDDLIDGLFLISDLPKDVELSDDTRLDKINFVEQDEDSIPNLRTIEQAVLLANILLIRKSQAQDCQLDEETKALLCALVQYPKNWSLLFSALILRSRIESSDFRAMQRSVTQYEELVNAVQREDPSRHERLKLFYSSMCITNWNLQQELARLYMKLGCNKIALAMFEKLHLWEDVIICYNELQMRQRSAEIIRDLLAKQETPKFWCLLGDATDDVECYQKAWILSGEKSSRVQRCLGNYYYVRKNYQQAIEHYERSISINGLQFLVLQRLAYCTLQVGDWEKCAQAYRQCSVLEPDSFECWNNMSQAYLKLGENYRAWKALEEAVRCTTNNWHVLDNYMLVSASLGYMNQALNAYNDILQYKERHVDTEILGRIVKAVIENKKDPEGRDLRLLHGKCITLLGKLTREVPTQSELWYLYAELVYSQPEGSEMTRHTAMQYYRKSVAAASQKTGWDKSTDSACLVLMKIMQLLKVCQEVGKESNVRAAISDLSSVVMLIKTCTSSVKRSQVDIATGNIVEKVKILLEEVESELGKVTSLINQLRSTNSLSVIL